MKHIKQELVTFFNSRVERYVIGIGFDEEDFYVRKEIRDSLRARIINSPESMIRTILRIELELEQGVSDADVFPPEVVRAAKNYAEMRKNKLKANSYADFISGWTRAESGTDASITKLLAYFGARLLTVNGPLWATKKFKKVAKCRNMKI